MRKIDSLNFYSERKPDAVERNVFSLIGKDWLLITGGTETCFNSMTASWGGMGVLWNKNVAFLFLRRTRYTLEFLEKQTEFSLSVFPEQYRPALLQIYGKKSGRDCDKTAESGFTPMVLPSGAVAYSEASLVMSCRKIYAGALIKENILDDPARTSLYAPEEEAHRMFIAEITGVWKRLSE